MEYAIACLTMQDYEDAVALWRSTEGIGLSSADSREAITAYLERNPGMSFVARGQQGELLGAVLCGHDGRRGYLHHAAVRADFRGQGIGQALVECCLGALQAVGIDKCHLFVYKDNHAGREFWEKTGWVERVTLVLMSKDI
ncbi:MAG TPA: GNAT family N-acetyltransferase [Anaerolineaceae bacterium]